MRRRKRLPFRQLRMCKAGITLYMSLILLVILSLIAAGFYSVKIAAGRVSLQMGTEEGIFSAFAGYDRLLFDKYGLLFLDIGRGESEWKLGSVLKGIAGDASFVTNPSDGRVGVTDLSICLHESSVTGLVLASDLGGAAFERQICQQEKLQTSTGETYRLREKTGADAEAAREMLELRRGISEERAGDFYSEVSEEELKTLPAGYRDPVKAIKNLKKRGLLSLVFPDVGRIPAGTIEGQMPASTRALRQGFGMLPTQWEGGTGDAAARLRRFLMDDFCCYTDGQRGTGLVCQIEYGIKHQSSDRENLREVLSDLLKIREASNLMFLLTNPSKGREADVLGASMAASLLSPELAPGLSFALKTAWAYGEAIQDLRNLVNGGRVPIAKSESDWQLELTGLAGLGSSAVEATGGDHGLSYRDYLRLLVMKVDRQQLVPALMDLVEINMRQEGRDGFCLDCCVDAMEVELHGDICGRDFFTKRAFGYDMKE